MNALNFIKRLKNNYQGDINTKQMEILDELEKECLNQLEIAQFRTSKEERNIDEYSEMYS